MGRGNVKEGPAHHFVEEIVGELRMKESVEGSYAEVVSRLETADPWPSSVCVYRGQRRPPVDATSQEGRGKEKERAGRTHLQVTTEDLVV